MEITQKCPQCQGELKLVPAGISKKSGKPYDAFLSCKNYGCGATVKLSPNTPPGSISEPTGAYRPTKETMGQRKEFQGVMDYKADNIRKAQEHKDSSMVHLAECRDSVQLTIAEMAQGGAWDDKMIQERIKNWKRWLKDNIYEVPFV
jgi:hypothetical protein